MPPLFAATLCGIVSPSLVAKVCPTHEFVVLSHACRCIAFLALATAAFPSHNRGAGRQMEVRPVVCVNVRVCMTSNNSNNNSNTYIAFVSPTSLQATANKPSEVIRQSNSPDCVWVRAQANRLSVCVCVFTCTKKQQPPTLRHARHAHTHLLSFCFVTLWNDVIST